MAAIQIKGSEALQRKLDALGKDGPKAQRWGVNQGARLALWFLKSEAPTKGAGNNEFATGATKAALGSVEQRTANGYTRWIGIRDKEFVKKMYAKRPPGFINRVAGMMAGEKVEYYPRKAKKKGFIHPVQVTKKPFAYGYKNERRNPWFYPTWRRITGQVLNTVYRKTDERIKAILAKKG